MSKKNKILLAIAASAFVIVISTAIFYYASKDKESTSEKNFGTSYVDMKKMQEYDYDVEKMMAEVVPDKTTLIKNLEKEGYSYTIEQDDTLTDLGISLDRIYAYKKDSFIDICYGLPNEYTQEVFESFEDKYSKYYLLAINLDYVYCISDKKTFELSGFTSLANIGTQYIYD